jgi:hypothetical protein
MSTGAATGGTKEGNEMKQIMGLAAAIGITIICFMGLAFSPAFANAAITQPADQAAVIAD